MPGEGSIAAMITILRNNRKLLRDKGMFKKKTGYLEGTKQFLKPTKGKIRQKPFSKEKIEQVRIIALANRRKDHMKIFLSCSIAIGIILVSVLFWKTLWENNAFHPYPSRIKRASHISIEEKKMNNYNFYISDGDNYIRKQHWKNAIFQYGKAYELYPSEFDVNYRLALAYSYNCVYTGNNCDTAHFKMTKLLADFPDKTEITELKAVLETITK